MPMTTEPRWTSDLIVQALDGENGRPSGWHGPSLRALLSDVSFDEARTRLTPDSHTIWELVLHMAVWDEICVRRLAGEAIATTTGSPGDWIAVEIETADAWRDACARAASARAALASATADLDQDDLDRVVAGWPWLYRLMIHGTLHHDLYHTGQIALLKRLIRDRRGERV
jgi:uncharacterized damage-inducible protein DinB